MVKAPAKAIPRASTIKGKSKGKDKGKGKRRGHITTPDGKQICFAFNNQHEKCTGSCDRAHVCRTCLGTHPAYMCPKAAEGGSDR